MIKVHATFTLTVGRTVFREDKSVFKGDSSSLTWQLARRKGSDRKKSMENRNIGKCVWLSTLNLEFEVLMKPN